ncbi:unnamed protein product [Fusarium graminearum]|nr:unnamed protein product [Fusarium graminearum]
MKWYPFLAFGSIAQVAAGLKLIDESEDNGVICYTYLSTYLAAVDAGPAPALPTTRGILPPYFTNRSTSALPLSTLLADRESSIVLQDPDSTVALVTSSDFAILTESTDLFNPTATISSEASATSSQAEVTGQAVIFFVTPDTGNQRRSPVKKDIPGGFVNGVNPVDICADADIFQLADGQLLDNGSPVYYDGEPYKLFASDGIPPDGAITKEFAAVNGRLVFASRSLPGNNAGFCQDDTGLVYITFDSSPPGCDPVILLVYTVEQCRNGEISGSAQASSIISESTQSPITEPTSTVFADPTDVSASSDTALVVTATSSTVMAEEEEETTTVDSSSTDIPSQPPLLTSSLSLTQSTISTIESKSASLLPSSSSTDSIGTTVSEDIPSSSESSLEPSSSIFLSTDSTAMEPATEETTTSISTTTLPEETESLTQLGSTTTTEDTTATETTTASGDTTVTEETTTTAEETTTTPCNSEVAVTTAALLNPTPVFDDSDDHDDDIAAVVLPFNVAYSDQSTVYVSTNGFIGVGSDLDSNPGENSWLPTENIAPIAVCPYWSDLSLTRRNGDTIVYEVFDGQHGMQATFEWIVTSSNGIRVHFSTTFYKDFPQISRFSYYAIDGTGRIATTGAQNNDRDEYFELYGFVKDGASLFISFDGSVFETLTFDSTECGKGDPPDGAAAFSQGT